MPSSTLTTTTTIANHNHHPTSVPAASGHTRTNAKANAGKIQDRQHMDGRPAEYTQQDQASAAAQYPQGQDVKFNPSATPTSEYGMTPSSARAGQFPEYAQRNPQYQDQRYQQQQPGPQQPQQQQQSQQGQQPPSQQQQQQQQQPPPGQPPHMAHPPNPSISAASPTYPPQQPPYHYGHPEMGHYQQQPPMYRPGEYPQPPQYGQPYPAHYPPPMMHGRPGPPGGGVPLSTVYSFVPIPGTHQQKRPRRRYEEIERMYKCGWNGCEKAYGTLNHLNAHVTMQAHGVKRTPEEFKEIRKEWKQRKKEEESTRKQDDDRSRQGGPPHDGQQGGESTPTSGAYTPNGPRQLPPLGYAPAGGQVAAQYPQPVEGMQQYSTPPVQQYNNYSPYGGGPPPNQM